MAVDDLTPLAVLELDKINRELARQEKVVKEENSKFSKLKKRKKGILKQIEKGEL